MSDRMHLATRKGVFTIDRSKAGWSVTHASFVGDNCSMVMHDPRDGQMYAALGHGHFGTKMHRSQDGGETWEAIATPKYPEMPEGYEPKAPPFGGKPVPWALELVWALEPGAPNELGKLWCGTIPGGLFVSTDFGENWQLVKNLWNHPMREEWFGGGMDFAGIHSICVDPRDANDILIGISCGGVWRTKDGGESWNVTAKGMRAEYMPPERQHEENIQDPHCLVRCDARPDNLWVQHHNGIFRSTDNAATWTEFKDVKPSTFGFAVAVHPENPDVAWFIPGISDEKRTTVDGKLVVTRTRDGGQSFDILSQGLPQEHAYDIVFRHCLDVDESGQRLAFGTTTGSLFVSENGGDSWTLVSAHLPPIYAVRFVK